MAIGKDKPTGRSRLARLPDSRNLLSAVLALAVAGCAAQQIAQPAPPIEAPLKLCKPVDGPPPDVSNKPGYVQFAVSVTDASGKPITELKRSEFSAASGTQPVPIEFFRDDRNSAPASLAIIVDASGSMEQKLGVSDSTKLNSVRKALDEVVGKLDACDEVAVLSFGGRERQPQEPRLSAAPRREGGPMETFGIRLLQPWTTDHKLALSRLTDLVPYGRTPLYDSVHEGLQILAAAHYSNRALIVITDGMDTSSRARKSDAIAEARLTRIPIYGVGIGDPNAPVFAHHIELAPLIVGPVADSERVDEETLKEFSETTGGQTFIVSSIDKDSGATFTTALATLVGIVGDTYAIGLAMPPDQSKESPTIAVADHPEATVRAHPVASAVSSAATAPPTDAADLSRHRER